MENKDAKVRDNIITHVKFLFRSIIICDFKDKSKFKYKKTKASCRAFQGQRL